MVTVIIPTFNRGWIITEAVESILNQNYPNIETIVIDDGSTDDTAKKLSHYFDRITQIKQKNKGVSCCKKTWNKKKSDSYLKFSEKCLIFSDRFFLKCLGKQAL